MFPAQAKAIVEILNKSHLWARTLSSTPALAPENRERAGERVAAVAERLDKVHGGGAAGSGARLGGYGGFPGPEALGGDKGGLASSKESPLRKAAEAAAGIATESLHGQMSQLAKRHLFSGDGCAACKGFSAITDAFVRRKQARANAKQGAAP